LEFGRKAKAKVMAPYKKPFLRCDVDPFYRNIALGTLLWK
jgi:hypothetical protein